MKTCRNKFKLADTWKCVAVGILAGDILWPMWHLPFRIHCIFLWHCFALLSFATVTMATALATDADCHRHSAGKLWIYGHRITSHQIDKLARVHSRLATATIISSKNFSIGWREQKNKINALINVNITFSKSMWQLKYVLLLGQLITFHLAGDKFPTNSRVSMKLSCNCHERKEANCHERKS